MLAIYQRRRDVTSASGCLAVEVDRMALNRVARWATAAARAAHSISGMISGSG